MADVVEQNFFAFKTEGSMGVVRDVHYVRCYWPKLDEPTALFADGSGGLIVTGPPTPRNVLFPDDTVFTAGTRGDCYFVRSEEATDEDLRLRVDGSVIEIDREAAVAAAGKLKAELALGKTPAQAKNEAARVGRDAKK